MAFVKKRQTRKGERYEVRWRQIVSGKELSRTFRTESDAKKFRDKIENSLKWVREQRAVDLEGESMDMQVWMMGHEYQESHPGELLSAAFVAGYQQCVRDMTVALAELAKDTGMEVAK